MRVELVERPDEWVGGISYGVLTVDQQGKTVRLVSIPAVVAVEGEPHAKKARCNPRRPHPARGSAHPNRTPRPPKERRSLTGIVGRVNATRPARGVARPRVPGPDRARPRSQATSGPGSASRQG